jgi:hypothetical protein
VCKDFRRSVKNADALWACPNQVAKDNVCKQPSIYELSVTPVQPVFFPESRAGNADISRVLPECNPSPWIGAGNAVEDVIEWNLSTFLVAMLARLDQPLGLTESCGLDEHDNLLFWCWVKEVAGHGNRILAF